MNTPTPQNPIRAIFSLPFLHRFGQVDLGHMVSGSYSTDGMGGWEPWLQRLSASERTSAQDYSYFFVPTVRRVLFPEMYAALQGSADDIPPARGLTPGRPGARLPIDQGSAAARLTWRREDVPLDQNLLLTSSRLDSDVAFRIEWMDALLLPQHLGVLILKLVVSQELTIERTAEFFRHAKKRAFRRRLTVQVPEVHVAGRPPTDLTQMTNPPIGYLVSDEAHSEGEELGGIFGANFSYMVQTVGRHSPGTTPPEPYNDELEYAAFAAATGHPGELPRDRYSERGMAHLRATAMLPSWENWRVLVYGDAVAIAMSCDSDQADSEHIDVIWDNIEWAYSLMQGLLLAQQVRLHILVAEVQSTPTALRNAINHLEATELDLVKFRKILWHQSVTTTPIGAPLYRLMHDEMGLDRMNASLREEIAIVKSRVETDRQRLENSLTTRTTTLITALTILGVPLGIYVTMSQQLLQRWTSNVLGGSATAALVVLIALAAGLSGYVIFLRVRSARSIRDPDKAQGR